MKSILKLILKYDVIAIIVVAFLSRLPLLLSQNLFVDGDECIVGLMAKHFMEGKELPIFFYGQAYGFSLFEVIPISIFFSLLNVSVLSLKLAMLCLWVVGIVFFYKTLKQIGFNKNQWTPFLTALVFIFMPSFAIWSTKARGGYLTAFALSSIVMYFLFNKKWENTLFVSFATGLLIILIYQSQSLWLAGLIPIFLYILFNKTNKYNISLSFGIVLGAIVFVLIKANISNFWSPKILTVSSFNLETLFSIPEKVYYNLTGSYRYGQVLKPVFITKILATIYTVITFLSFIIAVAFFFCKKKINPLFYAACFSVLFTIGYLMFIGTYNHRYLLPLTGYLLLMLYIFIINLNSKWLVNLFLSLLILLGAYSVYSFKNYKNNSTAITALVKKLKDENIKYVYCEGPLLQWKIMFHSNESVIARFKSNKDRYQDYIKQVNAALKRTDPEVALVGYFNKSLFESSKEFIPVENNFFIYKNPSKALLTERGFILKKRRKKLNAWPLPLGNIK